MTPKGKMVANLFGEYIREKNIKFKKYLKLEQEKRDGNHKQKTSELEDRSKIFQKYLKCSRNRGKKWSMSTG